jgi:cytochrome c2
MVVAARAQESDLAAGEKLYISQCKICHGSLTPEAALPGPYRLRSPPSARRASDVPAFSLHAIAARAITSPFAPPFGPHLRGVYGRKAGTVEGFDYSPAFLKSLKDMEWDDASLNVWITGPQLWVPGVYMFYKQPDPEVRRKIIEYLKAYR